MGWWGLGSGSCAALSGVLLLSGCNWIHAQGASGPSVLLVTIDTLRADRVGVYGLPDAATPTLDGLAASGVLFEQAIAAAPLTLPSHASILTGQYPPTHGVRHNAIFRLGGEAETVAERFQASGVDTGAVIGAAVLDPAFGLDQGFDVYDAKLPQERSAAAGFFERSAQGVTDAALSWLRRTDGRFFLWVHYYDVHGSYHPPEPFKTRFAKRPYDGEVAYVDQELGRLLQGLEQSGRRSNTLVAVTADHGEGLGEHGEAYHSYLIYDSVLHVPLLLSGPGVPAGRRVPSVVSTTGLAATLLHLAGLPALTKTDVGDLTPLFRDLATRTGAAGARPRSPLAGRTPRLWPASSTTAGRRSMRSAAIPSTTSAHRVPSSSLAPPIRGSATTCCRRSSPSTPALLRWPSSTSRRYSRAARSSARSTSMPRHEPRSRRSATWCRRAPS